MATLGRDAWRILDWLVHKLPYVTPGERTNYPSYREGLQELGRSSKKDLTDGEYLNELAFKELALWLLDTGKPAITGLIIDKASKKPGTGYFEVNERETTDKAWWKGEIAKAKKFNWWPFLSSDAKQKVKKADPPLPPAVETPSAADLPEPPPRIKTTIYRILRDTKLAQQIKAAHGYNCQFCRESIALADGSNYAEAHHIRPLGGEHKGLDVPENVLCVCPNCHVLLDYGAIEIETEKLATAPGHRVGADYVRYHNTMIYRGKK